MLKFPKSTEFNKRIPKEKFYTVGSFSPKDKNAFVNDIDKIIWSNKLSEQTVSIPPGKEVEEIEIITVVMKHKDFDIGVLNIIRKLIPYNILFNIEYEDEAKLAAYRTRFFQTQWRKQDSVAIDIKGVDLDAVWENFIRAIDGGDWSDELTLDENLAQKAKLEKLQKELERLERQARSERQPRKKFEMAMRIRNVECEIRSCEFGMRNSECGIGEDADET